MNPITAITISDPELLAKLATATGPILFRGPKGEYIRWAEPVPAGQLPPGLQPPPLSAEEYEKLRQSPDSGITLTEFWKQVERGEWR